MTSKRSVLYSFRRCPYAIRARLALNYAQINVELREVELKNKPPQMLAVSPKGTVPVLLTSHDDIIEESLEIMYWALAQHDPEKWLHENKQIEIKALISKNDGEFKYYLDRYKYADRFPEFSEKFYRQKGEVFLMELEQLLNKHKFLQKDTLSLADMAIFPFIRQFANVDSHWFAQANYPKLQRWLQSLLDSELFIGVMEKVPQWDFQLNE